MSRLPDWEARLAAHIVASSGLPFRYGAHDCCLFAAGAVDAVRGTRFAAAWRGRYRTEAGAVRVLARAGHDGIEAPFTAALGAPVGALCAARGDVVSDGERMGVAWYQGGPVGLFPHADGGLAAVPISACCRAWRV